MTGCPVAAEWLVARWWGRESQQATCPQGRHIRRRAQPVVPSAAQSPQPSLLSGAGGSQRRSSKSEVCTQLIVVNHGPRETAAHPRTPGRSSPPVSTELTLIALVLGSLAVTAACRRFG